MKVFPRAVRYSSVVGGGVILATAEDQGQFQIMIMGYLGISKTQSDAIVQAIVDALKDGIEVPE